jgi:hypothetical protein
MIPNAFLVKEEVPMEIPKPEQDLMINCIDE